MEVSNLGASIGRRGLGAPGEAVTSLVQGGSATLDGGTSAATAFVTGAIALLLSEYPSVSARAVREALLRGNGASRTTVAAAVA